RLKHRCQSQPRLMGSHATELLYGASWWWWRPSSTLCAPTAETPDLLSSRRCCTTPIASPLSSNPSLCRSLSLSHVLITHAS
ncbi:unnamed protein product, partial [Musa banksii]